MQPPTLTLTQEDRIQRANDKSILVLGSGQHHPSVMGYLWSDLPPQLELGDYDVIILNLVSFLNQQGEFGIRPERLPTWQQLARFLFNAGSEIICIGLPEIDTSNNLYQSITWWLPVTPEFVVSSGQTIWDIKAEFAYYFNYVRRWFFYATPKFRPHFLGLANYLRVIHPRANNLQVGMGAIAHNRLKQALAFKLMFRATSVEHSRALPSARSRSVSGLYPVIDSGSVIWLPPPTEISSDEAVSLILRERYGISQESTPPAWAGSYQLPQQAALEAQILQHQQTVERLTQELQQAQQQLAAIASFNRLLYEQHHESLALTVCSALQELGGQIHSPLSGGKSAICLTSPAGQNGILLVRARSGALQPGDLRQLDHLMKELGVQRNGHGKGILIVNTDYDMPPDERDEPFPPNCIRAAQYLGYCLMTTTQLFQAIASHQQQQLDISMFWQLVFGAKGVCSLPEIETPGGK